MNIKLSFLFFYALLTIITTNAQSVFIIIHGTWGLETTWYRPGGDFFDALETTATKYNACVVPFSWNGKNSNEARQTAADNLAKLIETYDEKREIIIAAHSHGGNIAHLASQQLKKNKIFCLYTLGTPINKSLYPNMNKIDFCYNLFSFEDLIQPVFGMFQREHPPHERIANIRVIINEKEPDHSGLHHPLIGSWLPQLHTIITNSEIELSNPGIIHFNNTQEPMYLFDTKRKELLERDHQLSLLILNSLRKSIKHHLLKV